MTSSCYPLALTAKPSCGERPASRQPRSLSLTKTTALLGVFHACESRAVCAPVMFCCFRVCSDKVAPDGLVARIEDHEDSVYSVAWSAYNAWAFASLSYTGKLVVSCVPATEKYKILL